MGTSTAIAFNKLALAPDNIRKSDPNSDAQRELEASIESTGVLVNLIVTAQPKGKHLVHAGSRRFRALTSLVKAKKIPADFPVPCYILGEGENPEEAALIENTLREAMHPMDEYESYYRLHFTENLSIEKIAARFGKPESEVKKRLALGGMAPELRQAYREEDIDLESLQAYSAGKDWTAQVEAYKALKPHRHHDHYWFIREYFSKKGCTSSDLRVRFIGAAAYTKAGGKITGDLFTETKYFHDVDILDQLVAEKIERKVKALLKAGWKWCVVDHAFNNKPIPYPMRLKKTWDAAPNELLGQKAALETEIKELEGWRAEGTDADQEEYENKLDELCQSLWKVDARIRDVEEKSAHWTADQMGMAGCVLHLSYDGKLTVEEGFVRKEDMPAAPDAPAAGERADGDQQSGEIQAQAQELSQAVVTDLINWHCAAVQRSLADNPAVGLDLVLFTVAWNNLTNDYGRSSPLNISSRATLGDAQIAGDEMATRAQKEMKALRSKLDLAWLDDTDVVGSYLRFCELGPNEKQLIVGWCAAGLLEPRRRHIKEAEVIDYVMVMCGTAVGNYWRPTSDNFFKRVPMSLSFSAAAEMFNDPEYPEDNKRLKKKDLMIRLDERIEEMEGTDCWVPTLMRQRV